MIRRGSAIVVNDPPRMSHSSKPPMTTERVGRSTIAPGPKVETTWLSRCAFFVIEVIRIGDRLTLWVARVNCNARFDIAHGAACDELLMRDAQVGDLRCKRHVKQAMRAPPVRVTEYVAAG